MVTRGEIWWHEHPVRGRRPYLILSRPESIPVLNQLFAVPVTRTIRGIPTEVLLDKADGMPSGCVLSLDNVSMVRKSLFTKRITALGPEKMAAVCEALKIATSC